MKALLVSYSDSMGGAARACYRLHRALRAAHVDSTLMVRHKVSDDPDVVLIRRRVRSFAGAQFARLQRSADPTFRSHNVVPSAWSRAIDARNPDVVNLHWVGGDTLSIADIGHIRQPTVFTLHDMWAFCGAEHYASEDADARWRRGYDRSNRADDDRGIDLDRWTWRRKRRHWRPRHVICPSRWLADCAQRSALMATWPLHVIPYALDMEVFHPSDRAAARQTLNLPADETLLLFGADALGADPRKGYDLFLSALERLAQEKMAVTAVIFGQIQPPSSPTSFPVRAFGYVHDDASLAMLYSAADVVVVPSRRDNLPQCGTEAQACGTPVVAFDASGLSDVVEHGRTGYLAEPFSADALAEGIRYVLTDRERYARLSAAARERAVRLWSPNVIARQYVEVYREAAGWQPENR